MNKKALLSLTMLIMLVANIAAIAVPTYAAVSGEVEIVRPDMVVPGGAIEIEIPDFDATGGSIYFYLSKDDDPDISSGDIRVAKIDKDDVEDDLPLITLMVPTTVKEGEEYFVKVTDSSKTGADCIVSDNSVEILEEEDWPTITIDPESGSVVDEEGDPTTVDVDGEDINDDWEMLTATLFWDDYEEELGTYDVDEDFETFTAEDVEIPEAFMGEHMIIVLLEDEDTVGTYVMFEVEPSVEVTLPEVFSIDAEEEDDQTVTLDVHGFPEGTIDEDSIVYIIRDFDDGSIIDTFTAEHDEVDVSDEEGSEGTITGLATTLYEIDEGVLDIQFEVDGETITLEEELISSNTDDPGRFKAKMDATSGENGDDVEFMAIGFPAGVDIDVVFDGAVEVTFPADSADGNGAWRFTLTLEDLPGGDYTVKVKDITNARTDRIGTFTILPSVTILDEADEEIDEAEVEDDIRIEGEGFPADATFDTIEIGGEEVEDFDEVTVEEDGLFDSGLIEIPHVGGGGQDIKVEIIGDIDGEKVTVETTIVINPSLDTLEWKDPVDSDDWLSAGDIFPGDIMKFVGMGFKAGEKVTITFENDETETAEILSGEEADSDGDLEVVFYVPTGRDFVSEDLTMTIAGPTDGNEVEEDVPTSGLSDADAKLFFGPGDDGELTDEVQVGDKIEVIGVGFDTEDLTLEFGGEELKDVEADYGYFKTTVTIPELPRGTYTLEETATGVTSLDVDLKSKITLSTEKAGVGATITVKGTGWLEDIDVDVIWPDLPTLVSEEPDEDGNFEATFTVPSVPPGTYTLTFDDGEIEDPIEITFMVLGPLRITSLSMPTNVYTETEITITVNVMDYFNAPVSDAEVSGSVEVPLPGVPPKSLTFRETVPGIYVAEYSVPDVEGSYSVQVSASKPEAGGSTTATGSFYVTAPPPPPPDITELVKAVEDLQSGMSDAKSAAEAAKSTASEAKSAAEGAKSTASEAKSAAEAAKSATDAAVASLTTLLYITIVFSLLAFIFAIVSVVQLSRKIA